MNCCYTAVLVLIASAGLLSQVAMGATSVEAAQAHDNDRATSRNDLRNLDHAVGEILHGQEIFPLRYSRR